MPATFTLNSLPVADLQSPNDANGRLAKMVYTAGSGWTSPRMQVTWTFTDADVGQVQGKYELEIRRSSTPTASGGAASGTTLVSGEVSGAATTATPAPSTDYVEGNYYFVRLRVWDGLEWSSWDGWYECRVRWGLTTHAKDMNALLGATPTGWSVASLSTTEPANTDIVLEYNSTSDGTTGLGAWKSDLGLVLKQNWVHYRAWLFGWGSSPANRPSLDDIKVQVSGLTIEPDFWLPSPIAGEGGSIEAGKFVFGTQSLRMDGDGTEQIIRQQIRVEAQTDYILQARIESELNSGASVRLSDTATGAPLPDAPGTGLMETPPLTASDPYTLRTPAAYWYSGSRTTVWVQCRINGAGGTSAFFDAIKVEKGRVASSWTPTWVGSLPAYSGSSSVVDGGGVQVDASQGGKFRLRTTGGNIVDLGAAGLELDGVPIGGVPSGVIVMWSGQTSTIPTGWLLCDGTSGTPDLRDRFIIGADSSNEGTSGGTVSASAALADHADHKHDLPIRVSGTTILFWNDAGGASSAPSSNTTVTAGGGVSARSKSQSADTAATHDVQKFYRLAYIMKS